MSWSNSALVRHPAAATLATFALVAVLLASPTRAEAAYITLDVTDAPYSAVGDGTTNDRAAIQAALNDAGANLDGGLVLIPSGQTFLSGGVRIPSGVTLQIDGILKQSQNPAHYNSDPLATPPISQPVLGKFTTSGVQYDQTMFHNDPFVLSWGTTDATLSGSGTIQMTWSGSEAASVYTMPVGFLNAQDFAVQDVTILDARAFNIAIYGSNGGVVENTYIDSANVINTDGVSVVNSQNVLVDGNELIVHDDGLYAVTRIVDLRDYDPNSWWTNRTHQPSRFVEFANNHVESTTRGATFRGTINGVADLSEVETTDLYFHDNYLKGMQAGAVNCWSTSFGAPMSRYTFENNTYIGTPAYVQEPNGKCLITDFVNDFGAPSVPAMLNGNFETTRDAWWSTENGGGVYELGDASSPLVAGAKTAAASLALSGDFVGYLQDYGSGTAVLAQGLGLGPERMPVTGDPAPAAVASTAVYEMSARVQTSGDPVRMFVYDSCAQTDLAAKVVTSASPSTVSLRFILPTTTCGNIRVGFDSSGATTGWALFDDVSVTNASTIDDADPAKVSYSGGWTQYSNTPTADVRGTRTIGFAVGDTATVTFSGKRGWLYGVTSSTSGIVTIKVDGVVVGTIDAYSATAQQAQLLFDTGELSWGEHEIEMKITGKNPASTATRFGFDAVLVDQIVDDNDLGLVTYSGSWSLFTNTPTLDIKGTRHVGRTSGSIATVPFTGSGVQLYGSVGPSLGIITVYLDGAATPVATIDAYSATVVQAVRLWESSALTPGSHTVEVRVSGTKNPASSDIRVGFDALLFDE